MSEEVEFKCKALQKAYEAHLANPQKLDCSKELATMRTAVTGIKLLISQAATSEDGLPSAEHLNYLKDLSRDVVQATKTMAEVEQTFKTMITVDQLHLWTQKLCDVIMKHADIETGEKIVRELLTMAVPINGDFDPNAPEPEVTHRHNRSEFQQILADWLDENNCTLVPHEVELRLRRDYVQKKIKQLSEEILDKDIQDAWDSDDLDGPGRGAHTMSNSGYITSMNHDPRGALAPAI